MELKIYSISILKMNFLNLRISFLPSLQDLFYQGAVRKNPQQITLIENGLKMTPQRIFILEAIIKLNNHPTVENNCRFTFKTNIY
jgi:hypothetical protein